MEQLADRPGRDAHPRGGDPRPARASPTCGTGPARPVRRPAAARRDRRRDHRPPRVLVLDEPTSALDPASAEDVLAAITRLVHDLGVTVVLAEHRLERVLPYADRVVHCPATAPPWTAARATSWRTATWRRRSWSSAGWPGWTPLPLSVRDARRLPPRLREQPPAGRPDPPRSRRRTGPAGPARVVDRTRHRRAVRPARRGPRRQPGPRAGECTALMGRNGSGQVVAALGAAGHGPAPRPARRRASAAGTRRELAPGRGPARWSAWSRRPRPTCSTSTPWKPNSARPTGTRATGRTGTRARAARRDRAGHRRRHASARPVRRPAARAGPGHPAGRRAARLLLDEPTRGLDYRAKASADRDPGPARRARARRRGRHARRRVRRRGPATGSIVMAEGRSSPTARPAGPDRVAHVRAADREDPRPARPTSPWPGAPTAPPTGSTRAMRAPRLRRTAGRGIKLPRPGRDRHRDGVVPRVGRVPLAVRRRSRHASAPPRPRR